MHSNVCGDRLASPSLSPSSPVRFLDGLLLVVDGGAWLFEALAACTTYVHDDNGVAISVSR